MLKRFRYLMGILALATISCAPSAPGPDSASSRVQQALAEFANGVDARLRSDPNYAGFYTEAGNAVFLFAGGGETRLAEVTSDPRARAGGADFGLPRLQAAREAVEADFIRSKVPFRLITTDPRRNRVVVDGIDRGDWDAALARRDISKRPEASYFFANQSVE